MQLCIVSIANFIEQKKVLLQNMYKVLRERASMEWEWDALIPPSYINTFEVFRTFEEKTRSLILITNCILCMQNLLKVMFLEKVKM